MRLSAAASAQTSGRALARESGMMSARSARELAIMSVRELGKMWLVVVLARELGMASVTALLSPAASA